MITNDSIGHISTNGFSVSNKIFVIHTKHFSQCNT